MGLESIKSVKDYKRIKEFLTAMDYYGIKETDLENIKLIPAILENQKSILNYLETLKTNISTNDSKAIRKMLDENIEVLKTNDTR